VRYRADDLGHRIVTESNRIIQGPGRTSGEYRATLQPMATRPKLTPLQVLQRLQTRLEKRMEALQRVKLAGYEFVISELEVELDYLRRAGRYLEE